MPNKPLTFLPMTLIRSGGLPLHAWEPLACGVPDWDVLEKSEQLAAEQLLRAFDEALSIISAPPLRTVVYNARKAFFQRRKLPTAGFEASIQAAGDLLHLLDCLAVLKQAQTEKQAALSVFEQNLEANYKVLQQIARDEVFHRALLFTSHDLLACLPSFAGKASIAFDKKDRRTALSVLQYLTRMVFKTSPLGRLTTVQVRAIQASDRTSNGVGEWLDTKSMVSPNVALLPAIYEVLLREPAFYNSLKLVLNPSIPTAKHPERFSITENSWLYFDGEREAFQRIEADPVADLVVKTLLGNERTLSFQELISVLETEVDATQAALQGLIFQLIDMGLLEWQLPERGLTPNWCGGLYNYLGYLPTSSVLSEAAYLMQWLRTAARTLPFQSVESAQELQRDTVQTAKNFLEKNGGEMPPIPPEQIFFGDVAQDISVDLPPGVLENLIGQVAECWQSKDFHPVPPFRTRIFDFAQKTIPAGRSIDFLEFSQLFLENGGVAQGQNPLPGRALTMPRYRGKIGALLQIFRENGAYKAIINAMYPGGGKLFARWLPLFPPEITEQIRVWQAPTPSGPGKPAFPWQGWSNANFQPLISTVSLSVPDGRVGQLPDGKTILLGNLAVQLDEQRMPRLFDKESGLEIAFNDLGLEAPETRPPVIQLLWHLGMPFVSSDLLLPGGVVWEQRGDVRYRARIAYQSLVLARATWDLPQAVWAHLFPKSQSQAEQIGKGVAALKALGIPRLFFGQFMGGRNKPQFYDMNSPISMLLFEKNIRSGAGSLRVTEMLPQPHQCLGERVGEFGVEFAGN